MKSIYLDMVYVDQFFDGFLLLNIILMLVIPSYVLADVLFPVGVCYFYLNILNKNFNKGFRT
jgi:hypothetical protein